MNLRWLLAATLLFAAGTQVDLVVAAPSLKADRVNIVWIFVEDMNGWYGCYGDDTVPTPNIDALARRGLRFDRAYMPAGVCSATRSALALGMTTAYWMIASFSSTVAKKKRVLLSGW